MASVQISYSYDMLRAHATWGAVIAHSATAIAVTNGPVQATYTGTFTYDAYGNVHGTLTGYTDSAGFSVSGLNVDAYAAEQLIESDLLQPLFQTALSGNDQFSLTPGAHVIDGYDGYNTVKEPLSYSDYTLSYSGAWVVKSSISNDSLYNIQGIYFSDGFYDTISETFSPNTSTAGLTAVDTSTGRPVTNSPQTYTGSVQGVQKQYISTTPENLNISVSSDNWFIHTGSGDDAIAVHGGTNVLDGGAGCNFLTGGNGFDTFFVDDRAPAADIWSTVAGFHAGDDATVWGVTPQDFGLNWADGEGAAGYTGLTLHATAPGMPIASLTLVGFSQADLASGRLSVSFGTDSTSGSAYMSIHANS